MSNRPFKWRGLGVASPAERSNGFCNANIAEGLSLEEAIELLKSELRKLGPAWRSFAA